MHVQEQIQHAEENPADQGPDQDPEVEDVQYISDDQEVHDIDDEEEFQDLSGDEDVQNLSDDEDSAAGPVVGSPIVGAPRFPVCGVEHRQPHCKCNGIVHYGKDHKRGRRWTKRANVKGSILCSNKVFGDPFKGVRKECRCQTVRAATKPPPYRVCAQEHKHCQCDGTIYYGKNGTWVNRKVAGSTHCSNSVFGDPLRGTFKECRCNGEDLSGLRNKLNALVKSHNGKKAALTKLQ